MAGNYVTYLAGHPFVPLNNICYSAAVGRQTLPARLSITASTHGELSEKLQSFHAGKPARGLSCSEVESGREPALAFLFTGQGSWYTSMGRHLYEREPLFRQVMERCELFLEDFRAKSLLKVLYPEGDSLHSPGPGLRERFTPAMCTCSGEEVEFLDGTALFSIEMALVALWESWGIKPRYLLGHSLGEYSAACTAGVFTIEEGLRLLAERWRLVQAFTPQGSMATVFCSLPKVQMLITSSELYKDISPAAVNGPEVITIAGPKEEMTAFLADLDHLSIRFINLRSSRAFHTAAMETVLDTFKEIAGTISFLPPQRPVISNRSGTVADDSIATAEYWCRHLCEPVQFLRGIESLMARNVRHYLEIGPDPILLGLLQCLPEGKSGKSFPSLKETVTGREEIYGSLGALFTEAFAIDWQSFYRFRPHKKTTLPSYPYQRKSYWWNEGLEAQPRQDPGAGRLAMLLGRADREKLAAGLVMTGEFSPAEIEHILGELEASTGSHRSEQKFLEDLFYRVEWVETPGDTGGLQAQGQGFWIIFADSGGLGEELARVLSGNGQSCAVAWRGSSYRRQQKSHWIINPSMPGHFRRFFKEALPPGQGFLKGMVYAWGLDIPPDLADTCPGLVENKVCAGLLHAIQGAAGSLREMPLWIITRGALPCGSDLRAVAPAQAPLHGIGRVLSVEIPGSWGGVIDMEPGPASHNESAQAIYRELRAPGAFDFCAFRGGRRYGAQLARYSLPPGPEYAFSPDGAYLITGGLGGAGKEIARWMARRGARHLVLSTRQKVSDESRLFLEELGTLGAHVVVCAADVTREDDVLGLLRQIDRSGAVLRGVFHCAGMLEYRLLTHLVQEELALHMAAKTKGAWNLHLLTGGYRLDFFILFSSAASILGGRGLGAYAAANSFLDALAHRRHGEGLPCLSINWGPWERTGMAASVSDEEKSRFSRVGVRPIPVPLALKALESLMTGRAVPQVAVYSVEWPQLLKHLPPGRPHFFFSRLAETAPHSLHAPGSSEHHPEIPHGEPGKTGKKQLQSLVRNEVRAVLRLEGTKKPDAARNLFDLGMDSLMALELRNRLSSLVGRVLPTGFIFSCPTIESIMAHLLTPPDPRQGGSTGPSTCTGSAALFPGRWPRVEDMTYLLASRESFEHIGRIRAMAEAEPFIQSYSVKELDTILAARRAILVYEGSFLIGFAIWEQTPMKLEGHEAFILMTVLLEKKYRGLGIGAKLVCLRNEYLSIDTHILLHSIFEDRHKKWALRAGFKKVDFNHFGPDFTDYYCDCNSGKNRGDCPWRDRECELFVHFPGDSYYPRCRPSVKELL